MASVETQAGADPAESKTESKTPQLYEKGPKGGFVPVLTEEKANDLVRQIQSAPLVPMLGEEGFEIAMPPEAAADYVAMLGAVETVTMDGVVTHGSSQNVKYQYPSQAAIQKAARVAMAAHGWGAEFSMWSISARSGLVEMDLWFRHKSGYRLHKGRAGMPMENNPLQGRDPEGNRILKVDSISLRATISILRKYMMGAALNMGWSTPEDDAEQKQNLDFWQSQRNGSQQSARTASQPSQASHSQPQATQRTTTPAPSSQPPTERAVSFPHHPSQKDAYAALLKNTRASLEIMAKLGCNATRAYALATGRAAPEGKFPPHPMPCVCEAIIFLARACKVDFREKELPPDFNHDAYVMNTGAALTEGEGDVVDVLHWWKGQRTPLGIDRDKDFMKVIREPSKPKEEPKAEAKPEPDPRDHKFQKPADDVVDQVFPEPDPLIPPPPEDDDIPF